MKRGKKEKRYLLILLTLAFVFCWANTALADTVLPDLDLAAGMGGWLTNEVVRTILLTIGIAGVLIEVLTVGSFGLFGALGVGAFILYFLGSFWSGSLTAAVVWLILGGVALLVIEIFVTPGFGVAGVLGICAIFAALVMAAANPFSAVLSLLIALVLSALIVWLTVKNRKTRKIWSKLILTKKLDSESGFDSADRTLARFSGRRGRAVTVLRPAGMAEIDGEKVDVVTQGEFIAAGATIEVLFVEGMRVVVRESSAPVAEGGAPAADSLPADTAAQAPAAGDRNGA